MSIFFKRDLQMRKVWIIVFMYSNTTFSDKGLLWGHFLISLNVPLLEFTL